MGVTEASSSSSTFSWAESPVGERAVPKTIAEAHQILNALRAQRSIAGLTGRYTFEFVKVKIGASGPLD